MTLDDLKRLFTRQTLFRLDAVLSPRLVPILYALGLAGLLLWAVRHLFWTFASGFGNGLWGLLEIAVFGLLMFLALRILCEALLVWFKAHENAGETVNRSRYSASLLDEVREAIRDLAEEEEDDFAEADEYIVPATDPPPYYPDGEPPKSTDTADKPTPAEKPAPAEPAKTAGKTTAKPKAPRRTAKRTPTPRT